MKKTSSNSAIASSASGVAVTETFQIGLPFTSRPAPRLAFGARALSAQRRLLGAQQLANAAPAQGQQFMELTFAKRGFLAAPL